MDLEFTNEVVDEYSNREKGLFAVLYNNILGYYAQFSDGTSTKLFKKSENVEQLLSTLGFLKNDNQRDTVK